MASGCDAVLAGTEIYDRDVLKKFHKLRVISRLGVGLDNVDIEYAEKRNIKVYKTESNPALAVSELTLGIILNLLRQVNLHDRLLRKG